MKSTLELPTKELEFPVLALSLHSGLVILFTGYKEGSVVVPSKPHILGEYYDGWVSVEDGDHWEILPKGTKVTIEV